MRVNPWILLLVSAALILLGGEDSPPAPKSPDVELPRPAGGVREYAPCGRLEHPALRECSGIVASRKHPGVFWVHNDSGSPPQLFAIDAVGKHLAGPVQVIGATNRDWEDIAIDAQGRLIVADVGNNFSKRHDLRVYAMPEPELNASEVTVGTSLEITYPDQTRFPSPALDFDCESVIAWEGELFLFTKHLTNGRTRLYGLGIDNPPAGREVRLLSEAVVHGPATGADISPDGRRVALLALREIWLFDAPSPRQVFQGGVRHLSISMGQAEAVAFDGPESLLIVNEQREMYRVPVSDLQVLRP